MTKHSTKGPIEYDQLTLHDGEDDQKTAALHEFLEPIQKEKAMEWEGFGGGITITIDVFPDDTIQMSKDGWIRVVRRTELGSVTFTEKDM